MTEVQHRSREDLVVVLGAVPERVADLVAGLDEPRLSYRHAPAFPTLRELVGHLCEAGVAVDAALRQGYLDRQREVRIKAAVDPSSEPDLSPPVGELLEDFSRVRRRTVDLLRGLSAQDWARAVYDPAIGELTLYDICDLITRHELGHLSQVRNLITLLPEP
jgi:hypothetical protein